MYRHPAPVVPDRLLPAPRRRSAPWWHVLTGVRSLIASMLGFGLGELLRLALMPEKFRPSLAVLCLGVPAAYAVVVLVCWALDTRAARAPAP